MARIARIVIPGVAHHVTQRGNRGQPVFFSDSDRAEYLRLIAAACTAHGTRCLAWCLMDNHVHLVLIPADADGLRATLGEAHRRYTLGVNKREGWKGFLFQGRFASYPMDDAHLMVAVRYVENNPVAAGMVAQAGDWKWSSARSHIAGKRAPGDPLTDIEALGQHVGDWKAMLRGGLEAGDGSEDSAILESRLRTGRPLAAAEWIADKAAELDRTLVRQKPGRRYQG
jgi:putative transposase